MHSLKHLNLNPNRKLLRQFAGLCLGVGLLMVWRTAPDRGVVRGLWAGLAGWGMLGVGVPAGIRPLWQGWLVLTFPIAWIMSRLILVLLYFGVFTPLGLLMRALGRDRLQLRRPTASSCFRTPREVTDPRQALSQF